MKLKTRLGRIAAAIGARLVRRSTYVAAGAIAAAVGAGTLGVQLNTIGALVPLIVRDGTDIANLI